ncbi:uncharacterized protein LOC120735004 isoform X4 [Simochromis diagramma]|uniref:uncharacterized protein LOC120735004 isoform X4 n=1 Tax=Simochromis diagramma TaxID=43689 RepID=UPI001A7F03F9|nr:uncharacterized protein LOC120735004 isoform X4 [Simochromis diagramma]
MLPIIVMVAWIYVFDCLPLTIQVLCFVGCVARRNQVPVIYYINLILSNVIKICAFNMTKAKPNDRTVSSIASVFYLLGVMASLYFKMCIALERCFFITLPLLDCLRRTRSSVLVCVLVWAFCIVSVPLAIVLDELGHLIIYAALPGLLFMFCLARTFRALPAATSVPTQEKRRCLGILILLFFKYFVLIIPIISIFNERLFFHINWIFFLLCPFVDLVLCLFMRQGRIDRLLACLCSSV